MNQEWTEAEPHPEGGIVPAHWQSFCDDCITEELAADEANLCQQTVCDLHNPEEPAEDLPRWTVYAEGEVGSVLKLIYELSFSKIGFRIKFINVDVRSPGKPTTLVLRITYA